MSFQVVKYRIKNEKIRGRSRILFLSDLHNNCHGTDQENLISAVRDARADFILIGGDMLTSRNEYNERSERFLTAITDTAPVCYANGNHESCLRDAFPERYERWNAFLKKCGFTLLNNKSAEFLINGTRFCVYGYEIPLVKYRKLRRHSLGLRRMIKRIGRPDPSAFNILLAHNPSFGDTYFRWGADLICSGHNHGGILRLGGNRILLSPYGFPLPRYGYGMFERNGQCMIVTSGLGEHTIPVRIHNPMEIVLIELTS